ncbi:hypothetical protein MTO96_012870 [Rhipicephalus appendiculatus]
MYESCVSHQECSFRNPNLQCVDFLCYCPLPYVLTESHKCLEPSGPHNNMMFAIAPTAVLIAVLLLIGGAYTYRKVSGGIGSWSSGSSVVGLRSASDRRQSESTRRVSSAIRLGRKAEASRRMRLSLDEHGAALRNAKAPRHPPRFIKSKPRQQSIQDSQRCRGEGQRREAHLDCQVTTSRRPHFCRRGLPGDIEIPVRKRLVPPLGKFREVTKAESTTEDSFMREIRFKMRASSVPTVSVQERAMSTDVVRTADTAVQLENTSPEMVDKSQQMSDQPSQGTELKVGAPVHKLVQKAKSQLVPANTSEQQAKRVVEDTSGSRQVSTKDDK